ncbi:13657_t:CDS:2, partial [Funneliformis caledonium]
SDQYRGITNNALKKAKEKGTFNQYNYLEVGKQLCYFHYLNIIEPDRNKLSANRMRNTNIQNNTTTSDKRQERKKRNNLKYKLAVLNEEIDVMCLPIGYTTGVLLLPELCDDCYKKLDDDGSGTNINSFLQRLEKGADTFSENDGFEEELQNLEEDTEEHENIQERDINLQNALEDIDKW